MISDPPVTCDAPGCEALADMYVDALVGIDADQGEHDSKFVCQAHGRLVLERLKCCAECHAVTPGDEPRDGYAVFTFEPESAAFKASTAAAAWEVCGTCGRVAWKPIEGPRVVVPF